VFEVTLNSDKNKNKVSPIKEINTVPLSLNASGIINLTNRTPNVIKSPSKETKTYNEACSLKIQN